MSPMRIGLLAADAGYLPPETLVLQAIADARAT